MASNDRHVMTGKVRFSYVHIFEPRASMDGTSKPKYGLCIIIPKSDKTTLNRIQAAIEAAKVQGKDKLAKNGVVPVRVKSTLRDGDDEECTDPNMAGCYYMNVSSTRRPDVVDANREPVFNPDDVYSGCYGRITMDFFAYSSGVNKGISAALCNVQKLAEGEPLGYVAHKAEDEFGSYDEDDASMLG